MVSKDDENSVTSDTEEVDVRDKEDKDDDDDDDDEDCVNNEEDNDEDEDDDEDEEEDDDDDDNEYDPNIIQFELFKNFLVDDEGNNVATNLKSIAHELRTLNKIAKLYVKEK